MVYPNNQYPKYGYYFLSQFSHRTLLKLNFLSKICVVDFSRLLLHISYFTRLRALFRYVRVYGEHCHIWSTNWNIPSLGD
jgi:hypothetical protein